MDILGCFACFTYFRGLMQYYMCVHWICHLNANSYVCLFLLAFYTQDTGSRCTDILLVFQAFYPKKYPCCMTNRCHCHICHSLMICMCYFNIPSCAALKLNKAKHSLNKAKHLVILLSVLLINRIFGLCLYLNFLFCKHM